MHRATLLAALAYLVMALVWAAPASFSPWDTVPDLGDPLHLAYVLAWDAHQLVRQPWALFDSNSFYPYGASLAFADHLLPEALLTAPVFWLTGNAVLAFNIGVMAGLVLSALAMFLLVRSLSQSGGAAFLAGLLYAFNSFTLHELPRVHVLHVQWWPLAFLFLIRFAQGGHTRDGVYFSVMLALQGLSGTYYLAYTALFSPLWIVVAYVGVGRRPPLRELGRLLVTLLAAAVPVLLVLTPYLTLFRTMGFEKSWAGGADLLSYLLPTHTGMWPSGVAPLPEIPHFLGFMGLLLMAFGLARVLAGKLEGGNRSVGLLALITGLGGLLLSLGPIVHVAGHRWGRGPYHFLYNSVPWVRGMASPERIGVLVTLGGSILAGIALARLSSMMARPVWAATVALLAVLLPLEHWHVPPHGAALPVGRDLPSVYPWLARQSRDPLIELPPYPDRFKKLWSVYPYFSTHHWRPVPLGRTSFYPPAHDFLSWSLRDFPDETSLTLLRRLGIETLVIHPLVWNVDLRRGRLEALDRHASLRLIRRFEDVLPARFAQLGLGEERVYRLDQEENGSQVSPLCAPAEEIPRDTWTLASTGVNKPDRARDGDSRSIWFTARPQRPGDRFEIVLSEPETLAAVALELAYPYDEFPRNLVLVLQDVQGSWHRAAFDDGPDVRRETLDQLLERPREARWVLRIPPQTTKGVRLAVGFREMDPAWPRWAIPEIRLYRRCVGGDAASRPPLQPPPLAPRGVNPASLAAHASLDGLPASRATRHHASRSCAWKTLT